MSNRKLRTALEAELIIGWRKLIGWLGKLNSFHEEWGLRDMKN
jgi:hypothetical protein